MNSIGIMVFWCVAQVTLLTCVAGAVYFAGRRLGPAMGAFVSLVSLLLMTVITMLSFCPWPNWVPAIESRLHDAASSAVASGVPIGPESNGTVITGTSGQVSGPGVDASGSPLAAAAQAFWQEIRHPSSAAGRSSSALNWAGLMAVIVLTGVIVGSVRLVMGLLSVRWYLRDSRPIRDASVLELVDILAAQLRCTRPIAVRECPRTPGAATVGWRHPLILLPTGWRQWSESDRRAIMAHEMAHIHNADYLTWLIAQIGLVLHFYHPLAHWLCRCLRVDQELVADATAAMLVGGRQSYLQSLAKIALAQADVSLSWPARTFLPTRRTFLRRIEMLRDSKEKWLAQSPVSARWFTAVVLIATGLAVSGLRGPGGSASGIAQAQQPAPAKGALSEAQQKTNEYFSLAYVPRDAMGVAALRPAAMLRRAALQPLTAMIQKMGDVEKELGVSPAQVESLQLLVLPPFEQPQRAPPIAVIVRLSSADAAKKLAQHLGPQATKDVYGGQEYFHQPPGTFYFLADDMTLVFSHDISILRRCIVAGPVGASTAAWAGAWGGVAGNDVAALLHTATLRGIVARELAGAPDAARMAVASYAPLWEKSDTAVASVQLTDSLTLRATTTSQSPDEAIRVRDTLMAGVTIVKNLLVQSRQAAAASRSADGPLLLGAIDIAGVLLESLKISHMNTQVMLELRASAADTGRLATMLVPAVATARESARRQMGANNLKQIGLAFHNFHGTHQRFPPAVTLAPNGVPRSWRVELLPFLDANDLYVQYRKEEPWDSEHNKKVLAQMPAVFRSPKDEPTSTRSSYFVVTGPGTVFDGPAGRQLLEIVDGSSNTILAVEAKRDIPWTKPEDLPLVSDKPLPKFGGWHAAGFFAALCDGAVYFIEESVDAKVLRLYITRGDHTPTPRLTKP